MSDAQLPIPAIVGGSVGGIVAITAAILLYRYIRRVRATPRQLERPKDLDLLMERPPSPRKQNQTLTKPSRKSSLMPTPYTYSNSNNPTSLVSPTPPPNARSRNQDPSQTSNPTPSVPSTSGKPSKHQPHSRGSSTGAGQALKKSSSAKPYITASQPSPTTSTEQMIPAADRGEKSPRPSTGGSRPHAQATPERERSERERGGRVLPPAPYPAEKSDLAIRQTPLTDASLSQAITASRPLPQPAADLARTPSGRRRRESTGSRKEKSEKTERPPPSGPWPNEKATPLPGMKSPTFPSALEEKQAVARSLSLGAVKPTPSTPFPTAAEEKRMIDASLALAQSPLPVSEDSPGVRQRSNSTGARRPLPNVPVSPGLGLGGAALSPGAIVVVDDKPPASKLLKRSSSASSLKSRRASLGNRSSTTFELVPPPLPSSPPPPPIPTVKQPLKSSLSASATQVPQSDNPYLLPASRPLSPFTLAAPATPTTPTDPTTPTQPSVPHNSLHINAQNFPYPPPPIPPDQASSSRRQTAQSNAHYSFSALSPSLLPIPLPPTPSHAHPPSHSRAPSAFNGNAVASGSNSRAPSQYFPATPHTFASSQLASPTASEFESLPPPWASK